MSQKCYDLFQNFYINNYHKNNIKNSILQLNINKTISCKVNILIKKILLNTYNQHTLPALICIRYFYNVNLNNL